MSSGLYAKNMSYSSNGRHEPKTLTQEMLASWEFETGLLRRYLSRKLGRWFTPKGWRVLKWCVALGIALLLFDMFIYEPNHVQLNIYYIPVHNLPAKLDGLRVVQLSDLHMGSTTPNDVIARAVDVANSAHPDIVTLTGDFVTYQEGSSITLTAMLSRLHPKLGSYAVLGNHDHAVGATTVTSALERQGIHVLTNRNIQVAMGLYLVGMDNLSFGNPDTKAFEGIGKDKCYIMLAHTPSIINQLRDRHGLLLTGHTHGGQIRIPFLSGRMVPGDFAGGYISGWYAARDLKMYVNRGIGITNVPARFLCRPEVAVFVLESAHKQ